MISNRCARKSLVINCNLIVSENYSQLLVDSNDHLIQTYNDPFRFFNRIRINETSENLIADLQILIQYASNNEAEMDLYNDAMQELMTQILNFQEEQLLIYQQQNSNNEEY